MEGLCEGGNEPPGSLKASKYRTSNDSFEQNDNDMFLETVVFFGDCVQADLSRAVASLSKASRLGLALRNARWFESSWGKKFSHEISASVWERCPPSIVMHLGSYDR
ncbi:hypothetical protein ANN_11880 [Periplaneta americana]|uniref:Uncharacterized protein n=1 Tax=Periplaneta americana TaxID=6978 RepID=A0ABQ8T6A9_PERAM|nr:hypothetical protein ANN_11880 [Periplaneta americana]